MRSLIRPLSVISAKASAGSDHGSGRGPDNGSGDSLKVFEVDFCQHRLTPFPIEILRVTWLGRDGDPPNKVVTVWLRGYFCERKVMVKIMVQLESEAIICWSGDHYLNRYLEKVKSDMCQTIRNRLAEI